MLKEGQNNNTLLFPELSLRKGITGNEMIDLQHLFWTF
jgi:hypothetical protein